MTNWCLSFTISFAAAMTVVFIQHSGGGAYGERHRLPRLPERFRSFSTKYYIRNRGISHYTLALVAFPNTPDDSRTAARTDTFDTGAKASLLLNFSKMRSAFLYLSLLGSNYHHTPPQKRKKMKSIDFIFF